MQTHTLFTGLTHPHTCLLLFQNVQGHTKLGWAEFQKALELVAQEKGVAVADVKEKIRMSDGPLLTRVRG